MHIFLEINVPVVHYLGVRTAVVVLVHIIQQQDQEQQAEIVIQHAIADVV